MARYAFAINLHRCIGCRTCMVACKMENSVSDGMFRMRVVNSDGDYKFDKPDGTFPSLTQTWVPMPCMHCDNPPCVGVCPTGASVKREDGIVTVDPATCIACGACVTACPYGARFLDEAKKTAEKCDMCMHRIDAGIGTTMCQLCCPGRAITVGDIEDPDSEISKILAEKETHVLQPETGAGPAVFYYE